MNWFKAIENAFSTGRIQDRLDDLRAVYLALSEAHEALKAECAALQVENLALKDEIEQVRRHATAAPLSYPRIRGKH